MTAYPGRRLVNCLSCKRDRNHEGRGLCDSCYRTHRLRGTIDQFPRQAKRVADTLEDCQFLRRQGLGEQDISGRLGVTVKRLRAIVRKATANEVSSR